MKMIKNWESFFFYISNENNKNAKTFEFVTIY